MGEKKKNKNKNEQVAVNNFFDACKKTCLECGSSIGDSVSQISGACFGEESPKNDKKGQAVNALGKTVREVGNSFQKNFKKVTFKSALMDTSSGLGHFFRTTKDVGSQFLNDLFS